jgi:hypothetical protein
MKDMLQEEIYEDMPVEERRVNFKLTSRKN